MKRSEPYHCYLLSFSSSNFQPSDQIIFLSQTSRLDHGTRPHQQPIRSASDQTTTPDNQMSLTSDHRSGHASIPTPDHRQIRPPDQISPTDYHPLQLHFESAQYTQSREMVQVRCIHYGLGQRGYIELWMNLAKHTFHTRSA